MIRDIRPAYNNSTSDKDMARIAEEYAKIGMDSYSEYGVGASLLLDVAPSWTYKGALYAGCNIKEHTSRVNR